MKETSKNKNTRNRVKDSSDKDGEYKQIQSLQQNLEEENNVIDQKDEINEIEQQLRQFKESIQQLEPERQAAT